jgi:hypothetical protein
MRIADDVGQERGQDYQGDAEDWIPACERAQGRGIVSFNQQFPFEEILIAPDSTEGSEKLKAGRDLLSLLVKANMSSSPRERMSDADMLGRRSFSPNIHVAY